MKPVLARALGTLVVVGLVVSPAIAGVTGTGGGTSTSTTTRTEVHTDRVTSTHTTYLAPIIRDLGAKVVNTVTSTTHNYVDRYASDWRTSYYLETGCGELHSAGSTTSTDQDYSWLSFLRNAEKEVADTFIKDTLTKTGETLDHTTATKTVTDSPDLIVVGDPDSGGYVAQGSRDVQLDIVDYIWDNYHKETTRQKTIDKWQEYQKNRVVVYTTTTDYYATTPIVLNMDGSGQIGASQGHWMAHDKKMYGPFAVYDFFGTGEPVMMEWIGPHDGLLCRPRPDGTVDGTCLFGSSNGFENGYLELATLDTNGDHRLTGQELSGLAVWQDVNANAIVGKAELQTVQSLGITEIGVDHKGLVGSFVMNGQKMKMVDWNPLVKKLRRMSS